jgi:hypothetical protein
MDGRVPEEGEGQFSVIAENFPQRLVHFQASIVVDETLLSELIHEEIDSWARGANHFGEDPMTHQGNFSDGRALSVQMGQAQEDAREALFRGGSQQMSYVIAIVADARQQIGHERIGGLILLAKQVEHILFFDGADGTGGQCNSGGGAKGIAGETKLAKKVMRAQDVGYREGMILRPSGEPHASFLNVEKSMGRGALGVDILSVAIVEDLSSPSGARRGMSEVRNCVIPRLHS